jgi:hypothetical protein
VTAPRSIVLYEHILGIIIHNLLIIMRDNNVNGPILLLRDRLRLDAGLQFPVDEVLNELFDVLVSNLLALIVGELLVFGRFLDSESGELVDLEVEVTSMSTESFSINDSEVNLALVLDSNGFDLVCQGRTFLRGLSKDIC